MQTPSSDENSVCPSVRRMDCDKTEERSVQIFIPYERSFNIMSVVGVYVNWTDVG